MHENRKITEGRIDRFLGEVLTPRKLRGHFPVTITRWEAPGEPVPFAEAVTQDFTPFAVGEAFGRPWGTTWLHVTGEPPAEWTADADADIELRLDFGFTDSPGFQGEAMAYTPGGVPLKAINPLNTYLPVKAGEPFEFYLELASNPHVAGAWGFHPSPMGDLDTAGDAPLYHLDQCELVWRDINVYDFEQDLRALNGLMRELSPDSERRHDILRHIEKALDVIDSDDFPGTAKAARAELNPALARPAHDSALTVFATGHAHIDSAWLWPVRETVRKAARTFANMCTLMDTYPEFVFSASSAQQYAWVKQYYPELFERIRQKVAEGRFIPVGGMWVESDTNMPGSEAMARQFVAGKRFFLDEFGVETRETWLPDSFGYSANLPQISAAAGHEFFLTQKISWNLYNSFPHHTFLWEALDGTTQFTHFPPIDGYNGQLTGKELAYFEKNFKEKGRSDIGLTPVGHGDGGGGTTREMIEAAKRTANLEGSPKVEWGVPEQFFERARDGYDEAIPVWQGELYLELHRGTYSSQILTKQGNRRGEHWLKQVELISALAAREADFVYPYDEIDELWQMLLLLQFHDILPGSSIAWVAKDAEHDHNAIIARSTKIVEDALAALAAAHPGESTFNPSPSVREGIAPMTLGVAAPQSKASVEVITEGDTITVDTGKVRAVIDGTGFISSLVDATTGREAVAPGSHLGSHHLHRDIPNHWDAWEIEEHYRRVVRDLEITGKPQVSTDADGTVRVSIELSTGPSTIKQDYLFAPGAASVEIDLDIDWHERRKALKLAFGLDVRAAEMASETQFGYLNRGIPVNTSWDYARFETCAHRWVRVAEGDYGVAIANDSTYGHDVLRTLRDDKGTTTTVRLSILRAPEFPDPRADEGRHQMRVSVRPGASIADAIDEGYAINLPLTSTGVAELAPLVTSDNPAVRIETIKLADDRSGDVIARVYESEGHRTQATITGPEGTTAVVTTDLLERPLTAEGINGADAAAAEGAAIELGLRSFQFATLRFRQS